MMLDIVAAMDDPGTFARWFPGPSWESWRVVLRGAYGLPMSAGDLAFFRSIGDRDPPRKRVRELWTICGRRAGKDSIASLIVAFTAAMFDGAGRIRPGERPLCICLACDKEQAKIVLGYIRAYFAEIEPLRAMVTRETKDGFELSNGVDIFVGVNDFRAVRGRTILCAVFDEVAYWRSEESASPDRETYRAILPGMTTLRDDAMLIGISSPYRRAGLLYSKFKAHYGEDSETLVIKAPSRVMNPSLDQSEVDRAMADDPEAAAAEWLAEWRDDVAGFLNQELIESTVDDGVVTRPPVPNLQYFGFVDASSGQLPTPIFRARFLPVHARVSRIVWKGFAPLSLAVSTVVRTSASAFAAHMAR